MEATTQLETRSIGKVRVNWEKDLVKGDKKRIESPSIKKQTPRYIGYMEFMTKVVDS